MLTYGRASRYADAFDIDWAFGGDRIRIPILGDDGVGALRIENSELCYHDHRFPIASGTLHHVSAADVHARQHTS